MSELRENAARLVEQILTEPNRAKRHLDSYAVVDAVIGAIEASGRIVIDRARFERSFNVVTAAYEELSESADYGGGGTSHTCAAVEWLQPGDLEPLP